MTLKQLQKQIGEERRKRDALRKERDRAHGAAQRAQSSYCSATHRVERLRQQILTLEAAERILKGTK